MEPKKIHENDTSKLAKLVVGIIFVGAALLPLSGCEIPNPSPRRCYNPRTYHYQKPLNQKPFDNDLHQNYSQGCRRHYRHR